MTNPPFYSSLAQMTASAVSKSRPPNSSCTGAPIEMIYPNPQTATTNPKNYQPGGEVLFLTQLIQESLHPANASIHWFTAMLGHLSSLTTLITTLTQEVKCNNYCVWEFVQGSKTRRWGIAWSWKGFRPRSDVARGVPSLSGKYLPPISETTFDVELEVAIDEVERDMRDLGNKIDEVMSSLEDEDEEGMRWRWKEDLMQGVGMSRKGDRWSRKARRRKTGKTKRDEEMQDAAADGDEEKEPLIVIKVSLRRKEEVANAKHVEGASGSRAVVHVRWLQGQDYVLFESFCGWLKRKLTL
jgi:23S rRNA (adenine1618-N6)-methyltransferase